METWQQSPTDPAFVQNPYPAYARARTLGPLVWWSEYGMPAAMGQTAVQTILRDRRFGREIPAEQAQTPPAHLAPFYAVEAHSMLELEPPRHTRLRGLVLRAFTSRRIKAMTPEITRLAHHLINRFPAGEFDLMPAFCTPIPVVVICRLLGVPDAMAPQLLGWSHDMVAMYQVGRTRQTEDRAAQAATDFATFIRDHIAHRRAHPGDDLITHLIAARDHEARLSEDEMVTTCILLLNAGHEATVQALAIAIKTLLEHPPAAQWLTPDRIDATVDEVLRLDPPLHIFTRYAYDDIDILGHRFARGDQVALVLGAAGRDPAIWHDPDRFDPMRPTQTHSAFGGGLHFCVGAALARLELATALPILFARCSGLRLTRAPVYADTYHFHGLPALDVTV